MSYHAFSIYWRKTKAQTHTHTHTHTTSKANQTLGFLKRNLRINSSTVKEKAYKSLVRPKLEYCSTVWDPKCITNPKDGDKTSHRLVDQLEMVQMRAARWVTGRYHNTSGVLRSLDWRSLEQSRDSKLRWFFIDHWTEASGFQTLHAL